MSGGVDSSYAASLLKNNGYEVNGAYCIMHEYAEEGLQDAKRVAESLNIELHTIDLTEKFDKTIKKYFTDAYSNAKTPNPCIVCNPTVKFKALCDLADKLGAEKIATRVQALTKKAEDIILKKLLIKIRAICSAA